MIAIELKGSRVQHSVNNYEVAKITLVTNAKPVEYIGIMPKIPECNRCLFCAHDPHLVCAVHPTGVEGNSCIDFRANPELEDKHFVDFLGVGESHENAYSNNDEQWQPQGASYYNGELILQPRQRWTREQQLELLDTHPMFTGICPHCGYEFQRDYMARVHWDCPECGWRDETV